MPSPKFQSDLILQPIGRSKWLIRSPFTVQTDTVGTITVPADFETDLNSIPRVWWAVSPATDWPEAGVVHDYLYFTQAPKTTADLVYYELLIALGMNRARAYTRYTALRFFGGAAYRSHAK